MNADGYLWDKNIFAYCQNNAVNRADNNGNASASCIGDVTEDPVGGYHIDLSMAGNSSLWHSPLLNGEWFGYYVQTPATYNIERGLSTDAASGESTSSPDITVPQKAYEALEHLLTHNLTPMDGYKGGRSFDNDGRDGSTVLPHNYGPFKEFDIDPKVKGQPRNGERVVIGIGDGGAAWYTPDHYNAFYLMKEGFIK